MASWTPEQARRFREHVRNDRLVACRLLTLAGLASIRGRAASAIAVRFSAAAGAPLKAETVATLTEVLPAQRIRNTADLRAAADTLNAVEKLWRATPGQRSGITWDDALMVAEIRAVKADRRVIKYVTRAIGCRPGLGLPERAARLVSGVAEAEGWNAIDLDHAVWRFESGRPLQDDGGTTSSQVDCLTIRNPDALPSS